MGRREVDKRALHVLLVAVRGSEGRLRDYYRQMQEAHREIPEIFRQQYGGVRRLKDYLIRCLDSFRVPMHVLLAEEDENLLAACLIDNLPEVDEKLRSQRTKHEERPWLEEQRTVLFEHARELMTAALQPILSMELLSRQTQSVKHLMSMIPTKDVSVALGDIRVGEETKDPAFDGAPGPGPQAPQHSPYPPAPAPGYPNPAAPGDPAPSGPGRPCSPGPQMPPGGQQMPSHQGEPGLGHPQQPSMPGTPPQVGADSGLKVIRDPYEWSIDGVRPPASASPFGTVAPVEAPAPEPEAPPAPARDFLEEAKGFLFDPNMVKEHRVRAQVRLDLQDLARAQQNDDLRLSLVHLGSLLEGVLLDYGLDHRKELELAEGPDVWDFDALAVQLLGARLDPKQEPILGLLHACRRLLRPACQVVHPIIATGAMVREAADFLRWTLTELGYQGEGSPDAQDDSRSGMSGIWRATRRGE